MVLYNLEHIGSVQQKQKHQRTEYVALRDTADNSRGCGLAFAGPAIDDGFNPGQDCTANAERRVNCEGR